MSGNPPKKPVNSAFALVNGEFSQVKINRVLYQGTQMSICEVTYRRHPRIIAVPFFSARDEPIAPRLKLKPKNSTPFTTPIRNLFLNKNDLHTLINKGQVRR